MVLEVVSKRFSSLAVERGGPLEVQPSNGLLLEVDPARLEQALGNLVDNAFAYGGGRVVLSARQGGEFVELHVEDEGPGFPPEFIGSALTASPARSTRAPGAAAGWGSRSSDLIAEAHHGAVGARNRAAGGADVWIAVGAGASLKDASDSAHRPFISRRQSGRRCSTITWNHAHKPREKPA